VAKNTVPKKKTTKKKGKKMDITTIALLIIITILFNKTNPMISNAILLIIGLFVFTQGITTNIITTITPTITYTTIDPLITYALGLFFTAIAVINFIDLIDKVKREKNEQY